ncbi:MAG: sulfatase-like hydrolase/transferase [Verrucomicrobiota bacterium]
MNIQIITTGWILFGILLASVLSAATNAQKPNIILIMSDDLGAEGLACYNSTIYTTPNLDRLAANGAVFENAYATPLCTPTRVMIMSGMYPNRTGFTGLISRVDERARMPKKLITIGNYFQENGYKTAVAGKWQLGRFDVYPNQPVEHGFDQYCMWKWFFKSDERTSRYYAPQIWEDGASNDGDQTVFGPDVYTDYLLDFIETNKDEPYFVYFPMALVHSPFIAPPSLKELACSKYHDGMDEDTKNFGHMITYMDMLIGRIAEKIEETGQAENTLIIFTADNGCHKFITSRLGEKDLKGGKGKMTEAGCRVPLIFYWPGKVPPAQREEFFSLVDILPTLASITDIEIDPVDGMNLSHNLFGKQGEDRDHVFMYFKKEAFVRNKRFRLNEKGELFDIPITSDESRYSEKVSKNPEHQAAKDRLQKLLDDYLAIPQMQFPDD